MFVKNLRCHLETIFVVLNFTIADDVSMNFDT